MIPTLLGLLPEAVSWSRNAAAANALDCLRIVTLFPVHQAAVATTQLPDGRPGAAVLLQIVSAASATAAAASAGMASAPRGDAAVVRASLLVLLHLASPPLLAGPVAPSGAEPAAAAAAAATAAEGATPDERRWVLDAIRSSDGVRVRSSPRLLASSCL
jgi:hypothetical protein